MTAPLRWSAAIKGAGDVSIVSRCTGTLDAIKVKNGQRVKAGDVLFLIDSRSAVNSLEHAKADMQTAIAQRDNARLEAESNHELASRGIISDYLLRTSLNALQSAEAQVAELVDAYVSGAYAARCAGSSPVLGTKAQVVKLVYTLL